MRILFIGDIVGNPGREAVRHLVPRLREGEGIDFVVANAENAAGGSGITPHVAAELFDAGVSVITAGDHVWKKREIFDCIERDVRILRPLNLPPGVPGRGYGLYTLPGGSKIGVLNVQGRVFMQPIECPFRSAREAVTKMREESPVIIVDIHAEATSEKVAFGRFLDGTVSAVIGTHTHIQTADETILPGGCAYLTDAGMSGPYDSVIGRRTEDVLERFLYSVPKRFEVASGDVRLCGALVDIDERTGRATQIRRIHEKYAA